MSLLRKLRNAYERLMVWRIAYALALRNQGDLGPIIVGVAEIRRMLRQLDFTSPVPLLEQWDKAYRGARPE